MVLEDKAVDDEQQNALIFALSAKEAILETDEPLVPYQNLCLEIGGSLYVKVKETNGTRSLIYFTAKPPCFDAWMEQVMKTASVEQEGSAT
jgi:hypothetical protein